jgi:hypothetical protein
MAASLRLERFLDKAPCSLVEVDRRFREGYCLHHRSEVLNVHLKDFDDGK